MTGPHTNCGIRGRIPNGRQVYLACFDYGTSVGGVTTWSYVRYNPGTGDYWGWVSDYYLANGGSTFRCPL